MKMVKHKVIIRGSAVRQNGATPAAAGAVLVALEKSLHGAVDVAFRRSSTSGRRQPWLRQAGDTQFIECEKIGKEDMALYFEAPAFKDVAKDYYAQPTLFPDGPSADDTAFDVLADAAADVLDRRADSDRYDSGLLRRFHRFEPAVFARGVDEVLISGHRLPAGHPCRLSNEFSRLARDLYMQTPKPARVRVAGRLDLIQASTLAFVLLLPGGDRVPGVWKGSDFETLRALVNSDVAAVGLAVYRPSGHLLRVDADVLAPQRPTDRFFASVPVPTDTKLDPKSLALNQRKRGGVAAIWGQVPAEESDEDFLTAVTSMD